MVLGFWSLGFWSLGLGLWVLGHWTLTAKTKDPRPKALHFNLNQKTEPRMYIHTPSSKWWHSLLRTYKLPRAMVSFADLLPGRAMTFSS